jgi:hypothetical protein
VSTSRNSSRPPSTASVANVARQFTMHACTST